MDKGTHPPVTLSSAIQGSAFKHSQKEIYLMAYHYLPLVDAMVVMVIENVPDTNMSMRMDTRTAESFVDMLPISTELFRLKFEKAVRKFDMVTRTEKPEVTAPMA